MLSACALLVLCSEKAMSVHLKEVAYGVPDEPWDANLGNHRAVIEVDQQAEAVRVLVPWRRRDNDPAKKNVLVIADAAGARVKNIVRIAVNREYGVIALEALKGPGRYYIYYMPSQAPQRGQYSYEWPYDEPEDVSDPAWRERCGLTEEELLGERWKQLPEARTVRIESRTKFDSFWPMEVIATAAETDELLAKHPKPYLLFPEKREYPIRMTDDLPLRWIKSGPATAFRGQASRNEFYVFQIGVYAARQDIEELDVGLSDLRAIGADAMITAASVRCFNAGGVDCYGRPFRKTLNIPRGKVQALWIGVQIPKDAVPGEYEGTVTIKPANGVESQVKVVIAIRPDVLSDSGDGELWRHSRLRWLDSALGQDDEITAPYTPLEVDGRTVRCLKREVRIGDGGLLDGIRSFGSEILAEPMRFVMQGEDGPLAVSAGAPRVVKQSPGVVEWQSESHGESVSLKCHARMEFDGHINFKVTVQPRKPLYVLDIRLELSLRRQIATYLMGIGRVGGYRPREHTWRWHGPYDSFWIGEVRAGLHCELRGGSYHGPLLGKYEPAPPPNWWNDGQGGCTIKDDGNDRVLVRAFSGPRQLPAKQPRTFEFALLITPVKPLDTAAHFRRRFIHGGTVEEARDAGATIFNVHHANKPNPFINYPFLTVDRLKAFIDERHRVGLKVNIYYTARELSNACIELFMLRSLGDEVIEGGKAGGHTWLREHLTENYRPRWLQVLSETTFDASISVSGASRWYNYYIEGLAWLLKNVGIDGLYLDDAAYDRVTIRRVRKVLDRLCPGGVLDLHSNTAVTFGPLNQYAEYLPYLDSVWLGEGFRFNEMSPDQWLVETSGIPFGITGDILAQYGYSPWCGAIFGRTCRGPNPLWELWDEFGIAESEMIGYWNPDCPVRTSHPNVLATVYRRPDRVLLALASWADEPVRVRLDIDWQGLGLDPNTARFRVPAVRGMQKAQDLDRTDDLLVRPLKGWLIWIQ